MHHAQINRRTANGLLLFLVCGMIANNRCSAQSAPGRPKPTQADVRYGPHERNVLDFWRAGGTGARPLVIYIHGGGFRGGSKNSLNGDKIRQFVDSGISVAALHYRLLADAKLPAAHQDCRRAIQFLRSKARDWDLDPVRFGAFGGSAGAQLCMYLAFHDDMANPVSDDELLRHSTRLTCVATSGGQTTMEFEWWKKNIPGYERPHRQPSEYFGDVTDQRRAEVITDVAALTLLSEDDPPIFMQYGMAPDDSPPEDARRVQGWQVHHVNFGVALQKRARQLGVPAHLKYPRADVPYASDVDFFRAHLLDDGK